METNLLLSIKTHWLKKGARGAFKIILVILLSLGTTVLTACDYNIKTADLQTDDSKKNDEENIFPDVPTEEVDLANPGKDINGYDLFTPEELEQIKKGMYKDPIVYKYSATWSSGETVSYFSTSLEAKIGGYEKADFARPFRGKIVPLAKHEVAIISESERIFDMFQATAVRCKVKVPVFSDLKMVGLDENGHEIWEFGKSSETDGSLDGWQFYGLVESNSRKMNSEHCVLPAQPNSLSNTAFDALIFDF